MTTIEDKNQPIFTPEQEKELLKWYKKGASDFWASYETGFPIEDVCRWRAQGENNALVVRLAGHGVWKATQKVNDPQNERDAQWLLTHHEESKEKWGDKIIQKGEVDHNVTITWQ